MRLLFLTYYKQAPKERRGRSPDDGYDLTINVGPKVRRQPVPRRPVASRPPVGPVAALLAVGQADRRPKLARRLAAALLAAAQADRPMRPRFGVAAAVARAVADRSRLGLRVAVAAAQPVHPALPCRVRCR